MDLSKLMHPLSASLAMTWNIQPGGDDQRGIRNPIIGRDATGEIPPVLDVPDPPAHRYRTR
eukprot:1686921-Amphidinium_carterae.2